MIDNKRKKESGIDSSSSEKCVPGKSNAENKENISSSDLNKSSCSGVNINMANNTSEQISISGLAAEIQTLHEEN